MRISVDREDRGFDLSNVGKVDVYLDGHLVPYVITADDEESYIHALRPHPVHGGKFIDARGTTAKVEYRGGHVEIRRRV